VDYYHGWIFFLQVRSINQKNFKLAHVTQPLHGPLHEKTKQQ